MEKKEKLYANNNRNKEDRKCNGQQTQEEDDAHWNGLDKDDRLKRPTSPSETEEKSPLTPEEEKRWS